MFEIEKESDILEESGFPLEWKEEPETHSQVSRVCLRHFISGRLLQVAFYKGEERMGQILTVSSAKENEIEQYGHGLSSKKTLKSGGLVQNNVFKLISRSMGEEATLTKESVFNIQNQETGMYVATRKFFTQGE